MATPQRTPPEPTPSLWRRWLALPDKGKNDKLITVATPVVALLILVAFAVGSFLKVVEDVPVVLGGIVAGILTASTVGRGGSRRDQDEDPPE